jgi:hypothetical protein
MNLNPNLSTVTTNSSIAMMLNVIVICAGNILPDIKGELMKDNEARESIILLSADNHRIASVLNDTRAIGVWRDCQKCEHETYQKIINRIPALYYCPGCDTTWKPCMPDMAVESCEAQGKIGFNMEIKNEESRNPLEG